MIVMTSFWSVIEGFTSLVAGFGRLMTSAIPLKSKEFENQTELSSLTDAEFAVAKRPVESWIGMMFYQPLCFIVFLGPLRVVSVAVVSLFTVCVIVVIRLVMGALAMPREGHFACVAVARFGIRCVLFAFGVVYITTHDHPDQAARFLVCNHVGPLDGLVIFFLRDFAVAIDKVYRQPRPAELVLDCLNPIWVDWGDKAACRRMICDAVDDFGRPPVLLFPEGVSSPGCGSVLLKFGKRAFSTPYKVQPIAIRYHMLVPKAWNSYAYRGEGVVWFLWRMFAFPPSLVSLHFLPAISMDSAGKGDMRKFTVVGQLTVANELGIRAVDRNGDGKVKRTGNE
jgi:1-acyl-sn-glycerol-3-phosphate acyltransferase